MKAFPIRWFHSCVSALLMGGALMLTVYSLQNRFQRANDLPRPIAKVDPQPLDPSTGQPPAPSQVASSGTPSSDDYDGDGIPNDWEVQFHHNPDDPADAGSDFDNDGLTTVQEYQLHLQTGGTSGNPIGKWTQETISCPPEIMVNSITPGPINSKGEIVVTVNYNSEENWGMNGSVFIDQDRNWNWIQKPGGDILDSLFCSDLNDQGLVSGRRAPADWSNEEGFLWSKDSGYQVVQVGPDPGYPMRLNNYGDWVGEVRDSSGNYKPAYVVQGVNQHIERDWWPYVCYQDLNDFSLALGTYCDGVLGNYQAFMAHGSWLYDTGLSGTVPQFDADQNSWRTPVAMNSAGAFTVAGGGMRSGEWIALAYLFDGNFKEITSNRLSFGQMGPHAMSEDRTIVGSGIEPISGEVSFVYRDGVLMTINELFPNFLANQLAWINRDRRIVAGTVDQLSIVIMTPDDDQDGDQIPDDWESYYGSNPNQAQDAYSDTDSDGTNNLGEFLLRSDPTQAPVLDPQSNEIDIRPGIDTDGDGIPNVWEWRNGLDYNDAGDSGQDYDRDGYTNIQEYRLGTNPHGMPKFRLREVGPLAGTSKVAVHSAGLMEASIIGNGMNRQSVILEATGSSGTSIEKANRPGCWMVESPDHSGTFSTYAPHGTYEKSTLIAVSSTGSALSYSGSSSNLKFHFWSGPVPAVPKVYSASAINAQSFRQPSFSPSGLRFAAIRQDPANGLSPIVWEPSLGTTPVVKTLAGTGASVSLNSRIYVNDHGYVALDTSLGSNRLGVLWAPDGTRRILQPIPGGSVVSVIGLTNTIPVLVAGNCRDSAGRYHAVCWNEDGSAVNLLVEAASPPLKLVSPGGTFALLSETVEEGERKQVPLLMIPVPNSALTSATGWRSQAQGTKVSAGSLELRMLSNAGELLGDRIDPTTGNRTPFLCRFGKRHDLRNVVQASSGYWIQSLDQINSSGAILGTAWKDGYDCRVLLTPDRDVDGDGLPDAYENEHQFGAFTAHSSTADADSDGLSDIEEFLNGTHPREADSDGDGMPDGWEVEWGLLPLDAADSSADPDEDRVSNLREAQIGGNPSGIFRLDQISTGQANVFDSGGDDGSVVLRTDLWDYLTTSNQFEYVSGPDAEGLRNVVTPVLQPSSSTQGDELSWWEERFYYRYLNPGGGRLIVHGEEIMESSNDVDGYGSTALSRFFPDAISQEWESHTMEDLTEQLRSGGYINTDATIYQAMLSPAGTAAVYHTSDNQRVILNEWGGYEGVLSTEPWEYLNNHGVAVRKVDRVTLAAVGKPPQDVVDFHFSNGSQPISIAREENSTTGIIFFSDDEKILINSSFVDPYGNSQLRYFLVDGKTGKTTAVRIPSGGINEMTALSPRSGRIIGQGRYPFQTGKDGMCVSVSQLRIRTTPAAQPNKLESLLPGTLTVNSVTSDGKITITHTDNSSERAIFQLVPINDGDADGVPDDWEIAHRVNDGSGDQDADGLNDADEFANDGNPFLADTDGDGMTDGQELKAGFNITNRDENNNGISDGYEDFDNDGYINREEALALTHPWDSQNFPDGTSEHGDPDGPGPMVPVFLVRSVDFETISFRKSTLWKPGFKGFATGALGIWNPLSSSKPDLELASTFRPNFYLNMETKEEVDESNKWNLHENEFEDLNNEVAESSNTTLGTRIVKESTIKVDGEYTTDYIEFGSAVYSKSDTYINLPNAGKVSHSDEIAFPSSFIMNFCKLGDAPEKTTSDTQKQTVYSHAWNDVGVLGTDQGKINNRKTITLSDLYSDKNLLTELNSELASTDWQNVGLPDGPSASFLWDYPYSVQLPLEHASAEHSESKYRVVSTGSSIPPGATVIFIWKELFVPQEGENGYISARWFAERGSLIRSGNMAGQFTTSEHHLKHPEMPGSVIPDQNNNGIQAPDEISCLNPGETPLISCTVANASGSTKVIQTVQRGEPIRFQVDLVDQKNSPRLTASDSSKVKLWERKKDGEWVNHSLPYNIPAEQSAGALSDPGTYVIQGMNPGPVTLRITANGIVRHEEVVEVRRLDVDVDSDNTGVLEANGDEEKVESDPREPGKILLDSSSAEADENGIPLHPEKLAGLKLQTANLKPGDGIILNYPAEFLRIWKTPPGQIPTEADLLIPNQSYTPSELGLAPGSNVEFSLQSLGAITELISIRAKCGESEDEALVRLVRLELMACKRGTIQVPGAVVTGHEVVTIENADLDQFNHEDGVRSLTPTDITNNSLQDACKNRMGHKLNLTALQHDDDFVKIYCDGSSIPKGTKLTVELELVPPSGVNAITASQLFFYTKEGDRVDVSTLKLNNAEIPPTGVVHDLFDKSRGLFVEIGDLGTASTNQAQTERNQFRECTVRLKIGNNASQGGIKIKRGGFWIYDRTSDSGLSFNDGLAEFKANGEVDKTYDGVVILGPYRVKSGQKGCNDDTKRNIGPTPAGWWMLTERVHWSDDANPFIWNKEAGKWKRSGNCQRDRIKFPYHLNDPKADPNKDRSPKLYQGGYSLWDVNGHFDAGHKVYDPASDGSTLPTSIHFKFDLNPLRSDQTKRDAIQIHPDGHNDGTLGCIGIQDYQQAIIANYLLKHLRATPINVRGTPSNTFNSQSN